MVVTAPRSEGLQCVGSILVKASQLRSDSIGVGEWVREWSEGFLFLGQQRERKGEKRKTKKGRERKGKEGKGNGRKTKKEEKKKKNKKKQKQKKNN